ncbi:LysR family transcriptional regulator [Dietzia aurantiaca]|uniref:LysR family transcriptional regulator n=1 Tax=Dietzia aurantiaca TaxID=983873 RepID=UPI001E546A4E|nr:LysR family transcriptional regulator [Dietzia aurantiaca]MCD2262938.1 LysR family transcriptional regulator [Dietzia aurantiaca]
MTGRLSIDALRYARAVAETGSFSAAARAYGVSQPALSNAIATLEDRLGAPLFVRSTRGASPTEFATRILPHVERTLGEMDALVAEARRLTEPASARIRVGVSPLIDPTMVSRAVEAAARLPGHRELVLRETDLAGLRADLLSEELDLILIPSVEPLPRFAHRVIGSEPIVVVGAPAGDGAADGPGVPEVELGEAAGSRWILVPDSCGLTTFTTSLFDLNALPLQQYPGEASSYRVLEQWANLGLGAALLPQSKLESATSAHRRLVEDGRPVEIFYEAVWRRDSGLSADLAALVDSIADR